MSRPTLQCGACGGTYTAGESAAGLVDHAGGDGLVGWCATRGVAATQSVVVEGAIANGQEHEGGRWLDRAREVARAICQERGTVTSDDIIEAVGLPNGSHAAVSNVFKAGFVKAGSRPTRRPEGHRRKISVWRLAT